MMRRDVESLVEQDGRADGFLSNGIDRLAADVVAPNASATPGVDGWRVGRTNIGPTPEPRDPLRSARRGGWQAGRALRRRLRDWRLSDRL